MRKASSAERAPRRNSVPSSSSALYVLLCDEPRVNPKRSPVTGEVGETATLAYVGKTRRSMAVRMQEHKSGRSPRTCTGTWRLFAVMGGWGEDDKTLGHAEDMLKGGGNNSWRHVLVSRPTQTTVTRDVDCLFVEGGGVPQKLKERLVLLMQHLADKVPTLSLQVF